MTSGGVMNHEYHSIIHATVCMINVYRIYASSICLAMRIYVYMNSKHLV